VCINLSDGMEWENWTTQTSSIHVLIHYCDSTHTILHSTYKWTGVGRSPDGCYNILMGVNHCYWEGGCTYDTTRCSINTPLRQGVWLHLLWGVQTHPTFNSVGSTTSTSLVYLIPLHSSTVCYFFIVTTLIYSNHIRKSATSNQK